MVREITDANAAAAFADARTRAILFALMKAERSLSELRSDLGLSLSLLHYHVSRLQSLELVVVSKTRKRAGRAIKIYQAAAAEFRVPGSLAASGVGAGLRLELQSALDEWAVRHAPDVRYFLDESGMPRVQRLPSPSASSDAYERWWRLRLSPSAASSLTREITALVAKYEQASKPNDKPHLMHFALVKT